jgi:hypothetical protein
MQRESPKNDKKEIKDKIEENENYLKKKRRKPVLKGEREKREMRSATIS